MAPRVFPFQSHDLGPDVELEVGMNVPPGAQASQGPQRPLPQPQPGSSIESEDEREFRLKMIDAHREASSKFTYYLAGLTLAVLTFTIPHYKDEGPKWA